MSRGQLLVSSLSVEEEWVESIWLTVLSGVEAETHTKLA
jgi:hypothetical protein